MWWLAVASAGELVKEADNCLFYKEDARPDGLIPISVSCRWEDVSFDALQGLIKNYANHDEVWKSVKSASWAGRNGEWMQVHHVHSIPGVAEREVVLEWQSSPTDNGVRHVWRRAADQPEPAEGRVLIAADEGFYQVGRNGDAVSLEAEFVYDPSGNIPDWVTLKTQIPTSVIMVKELHDAAVAATDTRRVE
jgi:hypothetical protein